VTQDFLLAMSSFEEVLEQLAEIHDREVARPAMGLDLDLGVEWVLQRTRSSKA